YRVADARRAPVGPGLVARALIAQPRPRAGEEDRHQGVIMLYIHIALIGALWAGAVAHRKHNNVLAYGIFGFLFPVIGVIAAYLGAAEPPGENEEPTRSH